ncbi:MAG: AAA family ATPase, partial [Candidatus Marinimicrobia bacterium]|nr:AAA family ATPase [Candidatus Neomarinimicrobiota bacterium]
MEFNLQVLNDEIQKESRFTDALQSELKKVLVGQDMMVKRLLTGLLSNGHILLEGLPGLAKTLTVNSLAKCMNSDFKRIQFTPDLLPADLVGTMIYNQNKNSFDV